MHTIMVQGHSYENLNEQSFLTKISLHESFQIYSIIEENVEMLDIKVIAS